MYSSLGKSHKPSNGKGIAIIFIVFLLLVIVSLIRWFQSPFWDINRIVVKNNTYVTLDSVQKIIYQQGNKNIFFFDEQALGEALYKKFPILDTISTTKDFFQITKVNDHFMFVKTLIVEVDEKDPVAIWSIEGKRYFLDHTGRIVSAEQEGAWSCHCCIVIILILLIPYLAEKLSNQKS